MRIIQNGETLNVSELNQLDGASALRFQSAVRAVLPDGFESLNIDLSGLSSIDCGGVGALIALRNSARRQNAAATVRLLNPSPEVRRMFQVIRAAKLFPIKNQVKPKSRRRAARNGG